ncbi:MAG: DNA-directed RNA polymerase subunit H [Candidatus Diapherotrites archaeon]|nr:DNA-directed RNA polymerase subunit H [Candidatus Diapherotrites archaeon]
MDNVLKHFLVPKHEIVPKEKEEELLKALQCEKSMMPRILEEDPAVEAIGGKKGDVLKITRNSPTAGKSIYFRAVY